MTNGSRCGPRTDCIGCRAIRTMRTRRLISNVEVRLNEGGYVVESNCIIAELRRSKQDIFAARMLHTLRPAGESFRIALKKVLLLNNDEPIDNLTFLV